MARKHGFFESIIHYLTRAFVNGLLTILPFTLTIGLFMLSARLIINWLHPVQEFIGHPIEFITTIPYTVILNQLFLLFFGVVFFGMIIRTLLLKNVMHQLEKLIFKIPLIRPVYSGIKQLIHAFSVQDKLTFKKVVLVEFPRNGIYSLGFLTSELPHSIAPKSDEKFFNVFIPTTPNPTTGFFVILSESNFQTINLTRQEAMALVISGGIILPDRLMEANQTDQSAH